MDDAGHPAGRLKISVTKTGTFSGKINFASEICRFRGTRHGDPNAPMDVKLKGSQSGTISLSFPSSDDGDTELRAIVEFADGGRFSAEGASAVGPDLYGAVADSRYTVTLPMRDGSIGTPQGDGFLVGRITRRPGAFRRRNRSIR